MASNNTTWRRGIKFTLATLLLAAAVVPFFGKHASAAFTDAEVTATWVNAATITVAVGNATATAGSLQLSLSGASGDFVDANIYDGVDNYKNFAQDAGCRSQFFVSPDSPNIGTLRLHTPNPLTSKCEKREDTITIKSPANAAFMFEWVDSGTIRGLSTEGYEKNGIFTFNKDTNSFVSSYETDGCRDYIVVNAGNKTGSFTQLDKNSAMTTCTDKSPKTATVGIAKFDVNGSLPPGGGTIPGGTGGNPAQQDSCESQDTTTLGWIGCAVIRGIDGVLNTINTQVQKIMQIDLDGDVNNGKIAGDEATCTTAVPPPAYCGIHQAWGAIRNIASILLVLFALIMVLSTAVNIGPFDAYTIRKILPRLVAAVIVMQISWSLMIIMIQIVNDIGRGISSLMLAPFGGPDVTDLGAVLAQSGAGSGSGFFTAAAAGALGVGALSLGLVGLLSLAFTTFLGILIGFMVLLLRNIVIIAALVLAPFAIVCYIVPNTEKIGKFWWDAFSKGLFMFPLIMILFTSGRIFAWVAANNQSASNGTFGDPLQFIIVIASYIIPYFLIPATFRLAGGAISSLGGMVNDRSKGVFDRNKKFRGRKAAENSAKMKNFSRFSDNNRFGSTANSLLGASRHPRALIHGRQGINAARQGGRNAMGAEILKNDPIAQANQGNDAFLLALGSEDLAERKINEVRLDVAENEAKLAQQQAELATETDVDKKTEINDRINKTRGKINGGRADLDYRNQGLSAARQVQNRKSAGVRMAAVQSLAQTGYQLEPGEQGYEDLRTMVREITGPDDGAFAANMNQAQFNLKNAGRLELAGINSGAELDIKGGVRKMGNYQRGQGKTDLYRGAAHAWLGSATVGDGVRQDSEGNVIARGSTGKAIDIAAGIEQSLASGEVKHTDVAEYHSMLLRDLPSATDANKLEIQKQIEAMERVAAARAPAPATGPQLGPNGQILRPASPAAPADPLYEAIQNNRRQLMREQASIPEDELNKP